MINVNKLAYLVLANSIITSGCGTKIIKDDCRLCTEQGDACLLLDEKNGYETELCQNIYFIKDLHTAITKNSLQERDFPSFISPSPNEEELLEDSEFYDTLSKNYFLINGLWKKYDAWYLRQDVEAALKIHGEESLKDSINKLREEKEKELSHKIFLEREISKGKITPDFEAKIKEHEREITKNFINALNEIAKKYNPNCKTIESSGVYMPYDKFYDKISKHLEKDFILENLSKIKPNHMIYIEELFDLYGNGFEMNTLLKKINESDKIDEKNREKLCQYIFDLFDIDRQEELYKKEFTIFNLTNDNKYSKLLFLNHNEQQFPSDNLDNLVVYSEFRKYFLFSSEINYSPSYIGDFYRTKKSQSNPILGFICFRITKNEQCRYLFDIIIDDIKSDYKGIGTALLISLIAEAKKKNIEKIILYDCHNINGKKVFFYEKFGFRGQGWAPNRDKELAISNVEITEESHLIIKHPKPLYKKLELYR